MPTVAVLGAGIGGISQVYELRKELGKSIDIVLVGDSERFEFTPSNPWVAVGWRKPKQVTVDLPAVMNKYGVDFHSCGAKRLHPEENRAGNGEERRMGLGIRDAWQQASTVFDFSTLELSDVDLLQAWERTRPFMKLVSREFRHALADRVRSDKELTGAVQLQIDGWSDPLAMRYPSPDPKKGRRVRHRFDALEMAFPRANSGCG